MTDAIPSKDTRGFLYAEKLTFGTDSMIECKQGDLGVEAGEDTAGEDTIGEERDFSRGQLP